MPTIFPAFRKNMMKIHTDKVMRNILWVAISHIIKPENWKNFLKGSSVDKIKLTLLHDTGSSNTAISGHTKKMKKIITAFKKAVAKSNSGRTITLEIMN